MKLWVMCAEPTLRHLDCFAAKAITPTVPPDTEEPTIWGDILRNATVEAARLDAKPSCEPAIPTVRTLLGVISYCYSKGVVSSAEIERHLWASKEFLATFGQRLPCALQLRNFRRRHRDAIMSVIARAHREFWRREAIRKGDTQFACQKAEQIVDDACITDSVEME